jgi:hypothetical protein
METADQKINFQAVASEATVSIAWLYSQRELRERIIGSRKLETRTILASFIRDRERQCRENIVATLGLRIKTLGQRNRELTELLERAYGVRSRLRRSHGR